MDANNRGADSLKVLNDIIGDFDEVSSVSVTTLILKWVVEQLLQENFKVVEKMKTMGTTYMAAIGLHPERIIQETEQSTAFYLSILVEFVMAMREKLEINNNSYGTHFQLRVGEL
jgi:UDP-glucose 4-epimerase